MSVCLQSCLTLYNPMDCSPPVSSVLGIYPGKNTGVSCHALLQGMFLTQGSNPDLLHYRQTLYLLNYLESPITTKSSQIFSFKKRECYVYRKGLSEVLPSSSSNSWDPFTVGKHHSFSFPKFNNQGGAHAMLPILPEAQVHCRAHQQPESSGSVCPVLPGVLSLGFWTWIGFIISALRVSASKPVAAGNMMNMNDIMWILKSFLKSIISMVAVSGVQMKQ